MAWYSRFRRRSYRSSYGRTPSTIIVNATPRRRRRYWGGRTRNSSKKKGSKLWLWIILGAAAVAIASCFPKIKSLFKKA